MPRKLSDWLDSFEAYTSALSTPEIFRKWTGLSILAAALERKVWVQTDIGFLYPNLYVFLVSPPGVGKTVLTSLAWRTLKELKTHKVASSSLTRATLIEELSDASRFVTLTSGGATSFNSLYICSNELGTLLPAYELEFMSKLTEIYDGHSYSEKRRNKNHNADIPKPQLNILAATQPGYLASMLPEVAWEQGFLSRAILVYSGNIIRRSLFTRGESDSVLWENLVHDLRAIGKLFGEFSFSPDAARLIDEFYIETHALTAPAHPKLQHYNTRRPAHLIKLCQIACVSAGSDMIITTEHYQTALDWMIEAETTIPNIFKAMQSGGDSNVIKDTWYYVLNTSAEKNAPVPRSNILAFLGQRVPSEKVEKIMDIMEKMKLLRPQVGAGETSYLAADNPNKVS